MSMTLLLSIRNRITSGRGIDRSGFCSPATFVGDRELGALCTKVYY